MTVTSTGAPTILCTLGPASFEAHTIQRLEQSGASLFRINLSHTDDADVPRLVRAIREATEVPICLDSEGAQIRTGKFVHGSITLRDNTVVRVHRRRVAADDRNFNLYPIDTVRLLQPGDFVSIDFNAVLVQVIEVGDDEVAMRVLRGGLVGQNKAVTVERDIPLPALTDKDAAALALGREMGLSHFALSFAGSGGDVRAIRRVVGDDAIVISKIETRSGLRNLEEIAARSDALLIDRGDLSRQIPLEMIPQAQKCIIRRAKAVGCPVYVATNLLESMVSMPVPTRAEVNDVYNTLADGADGLVLAAETAIGAHPVECVSMISKIARGFEDAAVADEQVYALEAVSMLVEPHGGRLVHREAGPDDLEGLDRLPRLVVSERILTDCEQFGYGTYSPLTGFLGRDALESVLDGCRLPGGVPWTLPILLPVAPEASRSFGTGDRVALTDHRGEVYALLDVAEIFDLDLEVLAERMFGTTSRQHPGVADLMAQGSRFVGGDVTLVRPLASSIRHFLLTPAQTRFVFTRLGWSRVVGFHTRNVAHRAHEWIQREALERTGADGLYINPVVGTKKRGDFLPAPIIAGYQRLLEFGCYPAGKVVLGSFLTHSRYAGPREAVFTALCRKNMGCSHFIVGRDHTGVGDFYPPAANRRLFESLGDLGVDPVFFDAVGYNPDEDRYEAAGDAELVTMSGTAVRDALRADRRLPHWFMRDIVQEALVEEMRSGRPIFVE